MHINHMNTFGIGMSACWSHSCACKQVIHMHMSTGMYILRSAIVTQIKVLTRL